MLLKGPIYKLMTGPFPGAFYLKSASGLDCIQESSLDSSYTSSLSFLNLRLKWSLLTKTLISFGKKEMLVTNKRRRAGADLKWTQVPPPHFFGRLTLCGHLRPKKKNAPNCVN